MSRKEVVNSVWCLHFDHCGLQAMMLCLMVKNEMGEIFFLMIKMRSTLWVKAIEGNSCIDEVG